MVKGGRQSLRSRTTFPRVAGKQRPCRDAGVGAIAPGFAMLARAKRASHIDPPPSSYAIMRRACPYRGENPGPGKDVHGELDHRPGIREQPGSLSTEAANSAARPLPLRPRKLTSGPNEKLVAMGQRVTLAQFSARTLSVTEARSIKPSAPNDGDCPLVIERDALTCGGHHCQRG